MSEKKQGTAKAGTAKAGTAKTGTGGKAGAVAQMVQPSDQLAQVIGSKPLARGEVISRLWDYIKKNKLQSKEDGRQIEADDKLEPIFGKKKVSMFEMNKFINAHLSKTS